MEKLKKRKTGTWEVVIVRTTKGFEGPAIMYENKWDFLGAEEEGDVIKWGIPGEV